MNTAAALLLLALAGAVLARPSLPVEEAPHGGLPRSPQPVSSEDSPASAEDDSSPERPVVALPLAHKETTVASLSDSAAIRSRRSPQGKDRQGNRGSASVDIRREQGRGTVARGEARGRVYENDRVRADVYGDWSKTLDGPGRAKPTYGGGVRFEW